MWSVKVRPTSIPSHLYIITNHSYIASVDCFWVAQIPDDIVGRDGEKSSASPERAQSAAVLAPFGTNDA